MMVMQSARIRSMNLLAIDTSTDSCSVAASRGGTVFSRSEPALQRQAEKILGMVEDLLAEARLDLGEIEGIAYGEGPGSFTGLRIPPGLPPRPPPPPPPRS